MAKEVAKSTAQKTAEIPQPWYARPLATAKADLLPKMFDNYTQPKYEVISADRYITRFFAFKDKQEYDIELHLIRQDDEVKIEVCTLVVVGRGEAPL